ncbi:MAG: hypothetical protein ACYSWW_25375 [Planctomycetota bacterium]|jgi:hypothetical protein
MKVKCVFFTVLVAFLVLAMNSASVAVDTGPIDAVLKKTVLDSGDFRVIDDFLAEAVAELVRERNFTSIARRRTVILSRKKTTQAQYAQQYSQSAHKHIQAGFAQAQSLRPDERKTNAIINLLILIDGMEDLSLRDLAIPMLKDQNMVVRYWAVHCLTNPAIVQQLNAAASSSGPATAIADQLKGLIEISSPEILGHIARFGASVKIPQGEALLLQVADVRIKSYADWTVKHELLDIALLKLLESKIPLASSGSATTSAATNPGRAAVARRFAQLYSYAIQRLLKGQAVLNNTQKGHLASVLVEIEEKCVNRLLGAQQMTFRRALERNSVTAISDEHNRLLGSGATPGQLPSRLGFNYGTNSAGSTRTAPVPLPDPPTR